MTALRSRDKPVSLGTLRAYNSAIRQFCSYLCDSRYGWIRLCERTFGNVPSQVCFEWNTPKHTAEDAVSKGDVLTDLTVNIECVGSLETTEDSGKTLCKANCPSTRTRRVGNSLL